MVWLTVSKVSSILAFFVILVAILPKLSAKYNWTFSLINKSHIFTKRIIVITLIILLLTATGSFYYHIQILPGSFRGMKWGSDISEYPHLKKFEDAKGDGWSGVKISYYIDSNDVMNPFRFGDFYKTSKIYYEFVNGKFTKAILKIPLEDMTKDSSSSWFNYDGSEIRGKSLNDVFLNGKRRIIADVLVAEFGQPNVGKWEFGKSIDPSYTFSKITGYPSLNLPEFLNWRGFYTEIQLTARNDPDELIVIFHGPQIKASIESMINDKYNEIERERENQRRKENDAYQKRLKKS